jgi:hypothetical protein
LTWKAQIDHALLLLKLIATKIVFSSFLQDGDQSEYLLYEEDKSLVFISKGLQEEAHPSLRCKQGVVMRPVACCRLSVKKNRY